jgi:3-deoxy-D-manno-octulosonate 8-phosphate phosphatase (KDO 8-P phosphatase)
VCDIDGVLTDGGLWFGPNGWIGKRFHVHDGMAVRILERHGIAIALITGDDLPVNRARARRLGIRDVLIGVENKAAALRRWARRRRLPLEAIVYMGDDINDLPAMRLAGCAIAVADARPEVRRAADYVTRARGGYGALREVVDMIVESRR